MLEFAGFHRSAVTLSMLDGVSAGAIAVASQDFTATATTPSWLVSSTNGNRMAYDSSGKLTWAPSNMVIQSQKLGTSPWAVTAGGVAVAPVLTNDYPAAPDGTSTATRVQLSLGGGTTATDISLLRQSVTFVGSVIFSIYLKSNDANTYAVQIINPDGTATGISVTPTWQRFFVTGAQGGAVNFGIRLRGAQSPTNSATADILAWGAQVEPVTFQTSPRTYIPTTTAAVYQPRWDYDPVTLAARGLLVEESRANLLTHTQTIATSWTDTNITRVATNRTSPDGSANALEVSASAGNATIIRTAAVGTSAERTFSIWLKRVSGTGSIQYTTDNGSNWTTQAITSSWVRYVFPSTTANQQVGIRIVTSGDAIQLWGAQLEAGFATSYIPSPGASSVTRAADILTLSGAALTAIGGANGALIAEVTLEGNKAADQYVVYGNSVSPGFYDSSLVVKATNGTNVLSSAQTAVVGTVGRIGLTWNGSGRTISYSASAAITDANSYGAIGSTVYLGSNNGANAANGWISRLSFYNQKLASSDLLAKTVVGGPL